MGINFDPLSVEFIVDSNLENWKSIYSWMRNLANIADDSSYNILDYQKWHHSASLLIYNPLYKFSTPTNNPTGCNNVVLTVNFKHIIPASLSGINFQSDSTDLIPQKATCSFRYSYYEITPDAPANLS
jgi:hypothetical protein